MHHHGSSGPGLSVLTPGQWLTLLVIAGAVLGYLAAALRVWSAGRTWPLRRLLFWLAGWTCVAVATAGPLPANHDFVTHMVGHLLIGMVAPLFLVVAAPMGLLLRTVPPTAARRLARALRSRICAVLAHPAVAVVLAVGGLWVLYRTGVYAFLTENPWRHAALQVHVLASGYLLTYAVLGGPDPAPHRTSPPVRAAALFAAIAAHSVLAKLIYASPPAGVPADQAQAAAQLMYYGAMPVELVLVTMCCHHWLGARRTVVRERRTSRAGSRGAGAVGVWGLGPQTR